MATQPDDTKPTIVLVHGAWADASGFAAEIRALKDRGFRAIGLANLLRGLAEDAWVPVDAHRFDRPVRRPLSGRRRRATLEAIERSPRSRR